MDKEVVFKEMMTDKGALYCGVGESNAYCNSSALSDKRFRWDAGPEGAPSERGSSRGWLPW